MSTGEHTPPIGERSAAQTPGGSNIASLSTNNGAAMSSVIVPQFGSSLNQPFSIKLDRNNFSLWRTVVNSIVRGHRLDGYLNGGKPKPTELIPVAGTEGQLGFGFQVNPEYEQWVVNDQLLMGWLYGAMTESIAMEVMSCSTSAELWNALEALFGAHSKAKMDDYRTKIQTVRKGSTSMTDYLRLKRQWADVLALAGDPYPENLLVSNVLSGLDIEYLPVVLIIESREKTSWQTLQDMLLNFDSKLDKLSSISGGKASNVSSSFTRNVANKSLSASGNQSPGNNRGRGGYNRGRSSNRGRGGRSNGPKPTCQVCGKYGHSAAHCYNRYDEAYMGSVPGASNSEGTKTGQNASAFIETPEMLENDAWFADTGASNHVTSGMNNLQQRTKYAGKDFLSVGNGNRLKIEHVGSSLIKTANNDILVLNEMLHVPAIKKNLISISKLTSDNNVTVEFSSDTCFVKDKVTKRKVLQGTLKEGLYQFEPVQAASNHQLSSLSNCSQSSRFSTFSVVKNYVIPPKHKTVLSVKDKWHRKLGHPSNHVLNLVLSQLNEKKFNREEFNFCQACQYGKSHSLPFKLNSNRASFPLELVHTDVWGPAPVMSNTSFKFYIHFIDDYSRYTWIYPLKFKSDALKAFTQFKSLVENKFDRKIKRLHSDVGGEYQAFNNFLIENGIEFTHSCPHTSPQNGRAERKHRHIVEMGLTLLAQANMPLKFWSDAFQTSVFLIN